MVWLFSDKWWQTFNSRGWRLKIFFHLWRTLWLRGHRTCHIWRILKVCSHWSSHACRAFHQRPKRNENGKELFICHFGIHVAIQRVTMYLDYYYAAYYALFTPFGAPGTKPDQSLPKLLSRSLGNKGRWARRARSKQASCIVVSSSFKKKCNTNVSSHIRLLRGHPASNVTNPQYPTIILALLGAQNLSQEKTLSSKAQHHLSRQRRHFHRNHLLRNRLKKSMPHIYMHNETNKTL